MDELFTRCPTCKTVFRTHEDQLSVQAGKVRCGHCRMVFDGRAQLVDLTPQLVEHDDESAGPPTVMLRRSMDLSPAPEPGEAPPPPRGKAPHAPDEETPPTSGGDPKTHLEPAETTYPEETIHIEYSTPRSWADTVARGPLTGSTMANAAAVFRQHTDPEATAADLPAAETVTPYRGRTGRSLSRGARWAFGLLSLVLVFVLLGQAAWHFRHWIAATEPALRPYLAVACATLGCAIEPLRNKEDITIESHDLQADPAHQGLLILQTTMRNRSTHPVAFPHLELELDDIGGKPVVRKVFAPTEYAGGAADFVGGIPASGEWTVKLFLDASGVNAGGYNLYLFYP